MAAVWWHKSKAGTICAEPFDDGGPCLEMPDTFWMYTGEIWSGDCQEHAYHTARAVQLSEVPEHLQVERDEALMKQAP